MITSVRALFLLALLIAAQSARAQGPEGDVAPLLTPLQRGGTLSLLWETYELANDANNARYAVTVSLTRERSNAGRIAMSVVGAITGAVGRSRVTTASRSRLSEPSRTRQPSPTTSPSHWETLPPARTGSRSK
jgi:hypothetical protein